MRNAGFTAMKKGILEFCGFNPVKITSLNMIKIHRKSSKKNGFSKWKNWVQE
jgi:hypothetical protein